MFFEKDKYGSKDEAIFLFILVAFSLIDAHTSSLICRYGDDNHTEIS